MRALVSAIALFVLADGVAFGQQAGERILVIDEAASLQAKNVKGTAVPKGVILTVLETKDDWFWVTYSSSKTTSKGWIAKRFVVSFDKALSFIDDELRIRPSAESYNIRSTIRFERGELDLALADCDESLRFDLKRAHVWNNRGNIWRAKGDTAKAIGDFNQAIRLDPNYQAAFKNRGNVWSDRGSFDKAIVDYTEALRLDPKDVDALNNRGSMWLRQKNYDKALADWNEAIRLEPGSPRGYNNLAWLLTTCEDEKQRNPERTVELATKACTLGSWKNASDIDTLAAACFAAGDRAAAIKWQTMALSAPASKKTIYDRKLEQYESARANDDKPAN